MLLYFKEMRKKNQYFIFTYIFSISSTSYYFLKICDFIRDPFTFSLRPSFGFSCSARPTGNRFS